jgi:hypothetical protein
MSRPRIVLAEDHAEVAEKLCSLLPPSAKSWPSPPMARLYDQATREG